MSCTPYLSVHPLPDQAGSMLGLWCFLVATYASHNCSDEPCDDKCDEQYWGQ